jgi:transposase-like protein
MNLDENLAVTRCDQCNSPVTDSIEVEIENHGRVKFGKYTNGSWICNDCMAERVVETNSTIQDDSNIIHHEHITSANKSDVSPNTPPADESEI